MTIEIKEKGTKKFYKEVANIVTQYRQLLYEPQGKLNDYFVQYTFLTVAMVAFFLMGLYGTVSKRFGTMNTLIMVFAALAAVTTTIFLIRMTKMVNAYLADDRPSVVTIDEEGIEIEKVGSQAVRLAWDNVAFVRVFNESTSFFSKDLSGIVLSVTNDYKNELLGYISDNGIDVKVVK